MRIGEILVDKRWVEPAALRRALAELRPGQKRTCSLLISKGLLDPDNAARALAEQHGVSGVLQRHLEHRDDELCRVIPGEAARRLVALPIGHTRIGELIVCVRDPSAEVKAELGKLIQGPILIAVAPASQLEELVAKVYPDSVDIDISTRPIEIRSLDQMRTMELGTLKLVELDDQRVVKDASQVVLPRTTSATSGLPSPPPDRPKGGTMATMAPRRSSGTNMAIPRTMSGTSGLSAALAPPPPPPPPVEDAVAALAAATSRDDATAIAMKYVASRWTHAVLLALQAGTAIGYRGHGPEASDANLRALRIPLTAPTIVKLACDAKRIVSAPGEVLGEPLGGFLGKPAECSGAPIKVGSQIACVLVVGAAISEQATSAAHLDRLATALAQAYERQLQSR